MFKPAAAEMMIFAFFNDLDFFFPWFIFNFFFGVIFGEPISNDSESAFCPFELFPKLFFLGTTLFRLDDRASDDVEADIGLEGPDREGEFGRDFERFIELNERDRRGDLGLVGDVEPCGEFGREL